MIALSASIGIVKAPARGVLALCVEPTASLIAGYLLVAAFRQCKDRTSRLQLSILTWAFATLAIVNATYCLRLLPDRNVLSGFWAVVGAVAAPFSFAFFSTFLLCRYRSALAKLSFCVALLLTWLPSFAVVWRFGVHDVWAKHMTDWSTIALVSHATAWVFATLSLATAFPLSFRTRCWQETFFLQSIVVLVVSALAMSHELTLQDYAVMSWSETVWAIAVSGLTLPIVASEGTLAGSKPALAPWTSFRALIGVTVFIANLGVVGGLFVFDVLHLNDGNSWCAASLIVLVSWSLANWVGLAIATGLENVRKSMQPNHDSPSVAITHDGPLDLPIAKRMPLSEMDELVAQYNARVGELCTLHERFLSQAKKAALGELAARVAHDIRSPLAAIRMVLDDLQNPTEDSRVLLRSAIFRIEDIANELLHTRRGETPTSVAHQTVLIQALIESLVSEKRLEYRVDLGLSIETTATGDSYGAFATIDTSMFKRVLSNLINNAVEAVHRKGHIQITTCLASAQVSVAVRDNGVGIPIDVLKKLGRSELSSGKASGNGIGVFAARQALEKWGGQLAYASKEGVGTTATISLPAVTPPPWFMPHLEIDESIRTIVVLDDDVSIHHIWTERLSDTPVEIVHLSSPEGFHSWRAAQSTTDGAIYLVDYEFLGQKQNGLDLIEQYDSAAFSALVTSRFEDDPVIERCRSLGVRLIPKPALSYLPIRNSFQKNHKDVDAILIDDDPLVRSLWRIRAQASDKNILLYDRPESFFDEANAINKSAVVYVDLNLGNSVRGDSLAERIAALGFSKIYLATGEDTNGLECGPHIQGSVGKSAPF